MALRCMSCNEIRKSGSRCPSCQSSHWVSTVYDGPIGDDQQPVPSSAGRTTADFLSATGTSSLTAVSPSTGAARSAPQIADSTPMLNSINTIVYVLSLLGSGIIFIASWSADCADFSYGVCYESTLSPELLGVSVGSALVATLLFAVVRVFSEHVARAAARDRSAA